MWPYTKDLLHRGVEEALASGSSTRISVWWLGFGVIFLGFIITVGIEWFTCGRNMTALIDAFRSWKSWVGASLALAIAWVLLFIYSLFAVTYRDHQEFVAAQAKTCPSSPRSDKPGSSIAPIIIRQGNGGTTNPGNITAPVTTAPCSMVQNGGSNNQGTVTCTNTDRRLARPEVDKIVAAAKKVCPFSRQLAVTAGNANQEAQRYATDFIAALKAGGCGADLQLPIPGLRPEIVGVSIGVRENGNLEEGKLKQLLAAGGITVHEARVEPAFFPDEPYILVIGAKPDEDQSRPQ